MRQVLHLTMSLVIQTALVAVLAIGLLLRMRVMPHERMLLGFLPVAPLLLLALCAAMCVGAILAFTRIRSDTGRVALTNVAAFFFVVAVLEVGGQTYAALHPGYSVLYLEPDQDLGWRPVPNFRYTWTGHHWYAIDFSAPIVTNTIGYRDLSATEAKPAGTERVALLGDSLVEALQVPYEATAGHLLEERLNAAAPPPDPSAPSSLPIPAAPGPGKRFEVLNFGVSCFGVGQDLLNWEKAACRFHPDWVFIYVARLHFDRTIQHDETGYFTSTQGLSLQIRPVFRLDGESLVHEPPRDTETLARLQAQAMETDFHGGRIVRRSPGCFCDQFALLLGRAANRAKSMLGGSGSGAEDPVREDAVRVGLAVLDRLASEVRATGARFVVVDTCAYHVRGDEDLSRRIEAHCREHGIGYLNLSPALIASRRRGEPTAWIFDGHFNERGNRMFADAMYDYMAKAGGAGSP